MAKATKKKSTNRLISSGFKFNKLSATALVAVLSVVGVVLVFTSHAATTVTYFKGHCKDRTHLKVVAPPSGATLVQAASVVMVEQQATDTLQCVNDPGYRGPIYTFVINGKSGLNMEPSGALYVYGQFGFYGIHNVNIELQHTDNKKFIIFNDFSAAAALAVYNQLAAYGVHP